jgi:Ca2+-binding RTX toxin-like protein
VAAPNGVCARYLRSSAPNGGAGAAGAATVSVEPYAEPPDTDPFGSCARYMMCPPDMVVFTAAAGESNQLVITLESSAYPRHHFVMRDHGAPVQAGTGCTQVDAYAAACTAGTIGSVQLDDSDDRFASFGAGDASGGEGDDAILHGGRMYGGGGNDVLVGARGEGGGGDDVLMVASGLGDSGDDVLRCFPQESSCQLDGGRGDDMLTGGTGQDRLLGRRGNDVMHGGAEFDTLTGSLGDDRLVGGAGGDHLDGDSGADRLMSREDRSAGEARVLDRVDCGTGRRDRALADSRDDVKRCERVTPGRDRAR